MSEIVPDTYLLDRFIQFVRESGLNYEKAAELVAEFAKQRSPEFDAEQRLSKGRSELRVKVRDSRKEYFVVRFLVKTRVRYVRWPYFPEFHVIGKPVHYWWCSIRYEKPNWKPRHDKSTFYIDDLYHDSDWGIFWMKEPYLLDLSSSAQLFNELTKKDLQILEGTDYKKINPSIVKKFKEARKNATEFSTQYMTDDLAFRKPPYGSKGWQTRVKIVPQTLKLVRLDIS